MTSTNTTHTYPPGYISRREFLRMVQTGLNPNFNPELVFEFCPLFFCTLSYMLGVNYYPESSHIDSCLLLAKQTGDVNKVPKAQNLAKQPQREAIAFLMYRALEKSLLFMGFKSPINKQYLTNYQYQRMWDAMCDGMYCRDGHDYLATITLLSSRVAKTPTVQQYRFLCKYFYVLLFEVFEQAHGFAMPITVVNSKTLDMYIEQINNAGKDYSYVPDIKTNTVGAYHPALLFYPLPWY